MRGKAMSGAPIMIGTNQLPKPPIIAGMTMKKIMIRPWAVVKTLKSSGSPKICMPGCLQLHAHGDRERAADDAGDDREDQVHRADVLVVGRIEPAAPAGRMTVLVRVVRAVSCTGCHAHVSFDRSGLPRRRARRPLLPPRRRRPCRRRVRVGSRRAACRRPSRSVAAAATQAANVSGLTARTAIGMKAWSRPQSSEHWP